VHLRAIPSRRALTVAAAALCGLAFAASPSGAAASGVHLQRANPVGVEQPPVQAGPAAWASNVSPAEADQTLDAAAAALEGQGTDDASAALNQVAQILPALQGQDERRGEALLARPTDGPNDPYGDGYTVAPLAAYTTNFCYFWVTSGPDAVPLTDSNANGIPDYIDVLAATAEHVFAVEHGSLGWQVPPRDGTLGCQANPADGRSRTDIYAKALDGLYGYVAVDPGQSGKRQFSFLVLDNDMANLGYNNFIPPLQVTTAHEYNHAIQDGYDVLQDQWMAESTATWMEEIVYPDIDDYLQYLPDFAHNVKVPLTQGGTNQLKIYGSAVWNHFLSHFLGNAAIRNAWAASLTTNPADFAAGAYDKAIRGAQSRSSFLDQFTRFSAATAEWRSTDVFPDGSRYPEVSRSGSIHTSDRFFKRLVLDHTTYRLLNVPERTGKAVKLLIDAPAGLASGLALVGRIGSGAAAKVVTVSKSLPHGGKQVVRLARPGRFARITAVVVNGDTRVSGFSNARGDWNYKGDNGRFDVGTFLIR
jgi:hypothetical protein